MKRKQDRFGRSWNLPKADLCPVCGQPLSAVDFKHHKLTDRQVVLLGGRDDSRSCPCVELQDGADPCTNCYKNRW